MIKKTIFSLLFLFPLFLQAQVWKTDFKQAQTAAVETNSNILLVFEGSDWCAPCIKLEKEILTTPEFEDYASSNFVLVKADFPRRRANALSPEVQEQNNQLAEKYNRKGVFPLLIVLDKNGNVLQETGYKKTTPKEFIKLLESSKNAM